MIRFVSKYHIGTRWRLRVLKHFMKFRKEDSVLDAGCGEGWISYVVSKKVKEVTAVDISKKTIAANNRLVKRKNLRFESLDLNDLNRKIKKKFDKIYCLDVLEHADNFPNIMHNFSKALKKGGELFMTIPVGEHGHFRYKDERKLEKVLMGKCFNVDVFKQGSMPFFTNLVDSTIKLIRKKTGTEQKEVDRFDETLSESIRKRPTFLFRFYQLFFLLTYWISKLDIKPYKRAIGNYLIKLRKT